MAESIQHVLDRVRPPRVQITYDVEVGDAFETKELPLVVGVLADLSGKPTEELTTYKDRKFVEIDRDNFDDVLEACKPGVSFQVDNTLAKDDTKLNVAVQFKSMEDFDPVQIIKQIKPLKELYDARNQLRDLLTKLDGNDELDSLLGNVITNTEEQKKLKAEVDSIRPADVSDSSGGKDSDGKGDGDSKSAGTGKAKK